MKSKLFKSLLLAIPLGLSGLHAQSVGIELQIGPIFSSTSTPISAGSLGFFVVDITGDGFAGVSSQSDFLGELPSVGNSFGNSNTILLASSSAIDLGGFFGFDFGLQQIDLGAIGATTGNNLGFYFFDGYSSSSEPISLGINYGFFRSDVVSAETGSDIAWIVPPVATDNSLFVFSNSIVPSSLISDADLTAGFTVVPEPSTYAAIVGLLALALVGYRRFRS